MSVSTKTTLRLFVETCIRDCYYVRMYLSDGSEKRGVLTKVKTTTTNGEIAVSFDGRIWIPEFMIERLEVHRPCRSTSELLRAGWPRDFLEDCGHDVPP